MPQCVIEMDDIPCHTSFTLYHIDFDFFSQVPKGTRDVLALEGIVCDAPREMFVKGKGDMVLYFVSPIEQQPPINGGHGAIANDRQDGQLQADEPKEIVTQL
jgi:hypothetical protein